MIYRVEQISRTLSTCIVIERDAAAFDMCRSGDVGALQIAFDKREISLFALDRYGLTLLDVGTASTTKGLSSNLL